MSEICNDCGAVYFYPGDRVRLVQNHLLTGQVIGEKDWHNEYLVRVGATVSAVWFNACELEPDPDFPPDANDEQPFETKADGTTGGNVVDFNEFWIKGRA